MLSAFSCFEIEGNSRIVFSSTIQPKKSASFGVSQPNPWGPLLNHGIEPFVFRTTVLVLSPAVLDLVVPRLDYTESEP